MNNGYIKIHRQIQDNPFYKEKRTFSKFEAWFDILISCNFSKWDFLLWYEVYEIHPWELITSKVKLCKKYNWSDKKLNNFLSFLEKKEMIKIKIVWKGRDKGSLIHVINWGRYQLEGGTREGTEEVQGRDKSGQYKKEKKEKKNIYKGGVEDSITNELDYLVWRWNNSYNTKFQVTKDLKEIYETRRKDYSYEQIRYWFQEYYKKIKDKDSEWRKQYMLKPMSFIKNKNNWFISYL